jgi:phytanoyl-CoA hydroxylase
VLTAEQLEQYHRSGFVNGGGVLDDATVETLQREVMRVIDDRDNTAVTQPVLLRDLGTEPDFPVWQIVNIWQASPAFNELIHNQKILEMVAQLSGAKQLRVWHDQIQYKPKEKGGRLHWHQDSPLWDLLQPKTEQLSAWIALDDADVDNGCMFMVPGSQKWGDKMAQINEMSDGIAIPETFEGHTAHIIMCPVRKGHVHFHSGLTWHGSGVNHSARPRRAIAIHLMTEKTLYDERGTHVMKPFVTVQNGEPLTGDAFPLVWSES